MTETPVASSQYLTSAARLRQQCAAGLLAERARRSPGEIAFRSKHLGLYRERSWIDVCRMVTACARSLGRLGVVSGSRVAIMGDPCEEWLILDLAAQAAGAITYGIYPTASQPEVLYQMADGGATIFVAENQEYVDKILPLVDRLPDLAWIVVIDTAAMFAYAEPRLQPYATLLADGDREDDDAIAALEAMAAKISPRDPAFIVYTSGTTGNPKGALVTHGAHLAGAHTLVDHYPILATQPQRTIVYLPMSHVLGRDIAITLPLMSAVIPHIGEDLDDIATTFFEVAPTVLFTVPRYLQKYASQVLVEIGNSSWLERQCYEAAMRSGRRHARRRWDATSRGEGRGAVTALLYRMACATVFRPVLNKLGFDQLRLVVSGGASLPPETMALWQIWGVNVVEI